jgi:hypothetical protein
MVFFCIAELGSVDGGAPNHPTCLRVGAAGNATNRTPRRTTPPMLLSLLSLMLFATLPLQPVSAAC